jgi:hypothetical protein
MTTTAIFAGEEVGIEDSHWLKQVAVLNLSSMSIRTESRNAHCVGPTKAQAKWQTSSADCTGDPQSENALSALVSSSFTNVLPAYQAVSTSPSNKTITMSY